MNSPCPEHWKENDQTKAETKPPTGRQHWRLNDQTGDDRRRKLRIVLSEAFRRTEKSSFASAERDVVEEVAIRHHSRLAVPHAHQKQSKEGNLDYKEDDVKSVSEPEHEQENLSKRFSWLFKVGMVSSTPI
ncbi:hypothetical protein CDL15_Pgr026193 [Punica granatum]|uniref:Uncharacterized protein n=1 Tax=Punica granatum TaxID=22663 RepID=A0A218VRT0_PUNGR|nr:hypothetical protein CDL15_Pgr026193 [Punica granatum]